MLENFPECYELNLKNKIFTLKRFWIWFFNGSVHGLVLMLIGFYGLELNFTDSKNGRIMCYFMIGCVILTACVIINNIKVTYFNLN